MLGKQLQTAAAGAAGAAGGGLGVEDVFSTWLYTGNGGTQTITNGIDLDGEGGLVWLKSRTDAEVHGLFDTARGADKWLSSNSAAAETNYGGGLGVTAFNSSGFSIGSGTAINRNGANIASWTFRKAEKFFDVVTWTGDGTTGRVLSHALGSIPGVMIGKATSTIASWGVYHRSLPTDNVLRLNSTNAANTDLPYFFGNDSVSIAPTATNFTVASSLNAAGQTYVAYLFAHDAGGFGDDGTESVIKCGSYTGNGSTSGPVVDLGWEPQWVLTKRSNSAGAWTVHDNMRGFAMTAGAALQPHLSDAEYSSSVIRPTSTGFELFNTSADFNASGGTYIYIAIRRGPMKTPEDATTVFAPVAYTGDGSSSRTITAGFPVDFFINTNSTRTWNGATYTFTRLTNAVLSVSTSPESSITGTSLTSSAANTGISLTSTLFNGSGQPFVDWFFRRAPGFFDVVCYTGTGVARTVSHNLGVAPELFIIKCRTFASFWAVGGTVLPAPADDYLGLNQTWAILTEADVFQAPTSTTIGIGTKYPNDGAWNSSGANYVAYLFASCPGVSKVGSYTGTGTTLNIDCGFTSGARFVMIKRTDSTGDWYVWDTARGIVSGNDPYLLLNVNAPDVTSTDYIDPLSSGFQISSTAPAAINASGGSFIFLAIA